jgi:hypothetical protein
MRKQNRNWKFFPIFFKHFAWFQRDIHYLSYFCFEEINEKMLWVFNFSKRKIFLRCKDNPEQHWKMKDLSNINLGYLNKITGEIILFFQITDKFELYFALNKSDFTLNRREI